MKKIILGILICVIAVSLRFMPSVYAGSLAGDYLLEFGKVLYSGGHYEEALGEFRKVLLADPGNPVAQKYVNDIFAQDTSVKPESKEPERKLTRDEAIDDVLTGLNPKGKEEKSVINEGYNIGGLRVSGEAQARLGITSSGDVYWKRANWDLNEKNWRIRSSAALDRKENTYDPRIYDRLRVNLDTDKEDGLDFHSNITVDPWSFTGKTAKTTVFSKFGDAADVILKYWSNTGYAINETINSKYLGNSFNLPELKVYNNWTKALNIKGAFTPNDTFYIPALKIYRQFQPVREFWVDYKEDTMKFRAYPMAYENQAKTFDDPLVLSNNRIWWENSPWLNAWKPGNYNGGIAAPDFTKGYWDNTLSFSIRDSEGQRLTALRGFFFDFYPSEGTSLTTSVATPKTLWQDYQEMDNFLSATRLKHAVTDNLSVGASLTTRLGYNDNMRLDAENYVGGMDIGYEIIDGLKTNFEVARSSSTTDMASPTYKLGERGNAYYFSVEGRMPFQKIMDTKYGYFGIQPEKDDEFFSKFRFFAARMDKSFHETLSSYVETRDDEWWSRHLHFRKPFKSYYQGEGQLLSFDDIKNYAIGNGIDEGRSTLGLRIESLLWDKKVSNLFDVRNVHLNEGKFAENVGRDELTWDVTDKLTAKFLGIYQHMPRTKGGKDPFIFNPLNREYYDNSYIQDGKDPSIATGSLGSEYQFFDWLALNGIWEYTNDISLAYDNFPRGILNDGNYSLLSYQNGNIYRDVRNFLTDQQHFPAPPYPYYNIFKAGLRLSPRDNLDFYLDYTRNPYEKAGQVDDNMNHVGLEMAYSPFKKLSIFLRYSYSRWQDLDRLVANDNKLYGHHNAFAEFIYRKSQDEDFTFQYGEASRDPYMGGVLDIGWDPYGGSLRTIDTQHIFRLYYRRKF